MADTPALELTDIAASSGSLTERARWTFERLRHWTPFDAAWVALADPVDGSYRSLLAWEDLDGNTHRDLAGPKMAVDLGTMCTNRRLPLLSTSELPFPAEVLDTWSECLLPAGFHEALAVGLFAGERHVGFLALLSGSSTPPAADVRTGLHRLTPIVARALDPLGSLAGSARVVHRALAGAALCRDGTSRPLPGLVGDRLLADGSPVVELACACLAEGQSFASFLWPVDDPASADDHLTVSVIASPAEAPAGLTGAVMLSPAPDLRGLTRRELQVLGLVVEGLSNQQIGTVLVVTPRTVATHVEHILGKLGASTRTLAAVRAQRRGLYVPCWPTPPRR